MLWRGLTAVLALADAYLEYGPQCDPGPASALGLTTLDGRCAAEGVRIERRLKRP